MKEALLCLDLLPFDNMLILSLDSVLGSLDSFEYNMTHSSTLFCFEGAEHAHRVHLAELAEVQSQHLLVYVLPKLSHENFSFLDF